MKVSELIAQLAALPAEAEVEAEGCDCINPVRGAGLLPGNEKGPHYEDTVILVAGPDFHELLLTPTEKIRKRLDQIRRAEAVRYQEDETPRRIVVSRGRASFQDISINRLCNLYGDHAGDWGRVIEAYLAEGADITDRPGSPAT